MAETERSDRLEENGSPQPDPLRSVFTSNLPDILRRLGISLAVSTYQAGKMILVREDSGTINTHFRSFHKPMGIAAANGRLTIGGANTVWTYRDMPAVAHKLEPAGKYDACYLPRTIHVTGDVDIHEMAYDSAGELVLVNTRFGALCTLDADHSFNPFWRPPFLSALTPEDRCHLNGLCMVNGRAKYVTALGETDTRGGWRENKKDGGILMDVDSSEVLLRGLSMPHSPRLYDNRLWLLESGEGSLARVDLQEQTWHTITKLPASRAASTSSVRWLSSVSARFVKAPSSAAYRWWNAWMNAPAACGWSISKPGKRLPSCALKKACRRFSPCKFCRLVSRKCSNGATNGCSIPMCFRTRRCRMFRRSCENKQ